jgi:hypothetical protein
MLSRVNPSVVVARGRAHLARGVERSFGSCVGALGRRRVLGSLVGQGGFEDPRAGERSLEGQKPKRATAGGAGQLGSTRTDSRREQSSEASEAGGGERLGCSRSRTTGRRAAARRKGVIAGGGTRRLRSGVGVGETAGDKIEGGPFDARVDDREGASGLERGTRSA